MDLLKTVIKDRPQFHLGETEISRSFGAEESFLSAGSISRLSDNGLTCYGIGIDVLQYISEQIGKGSKTLETGAGCSTLIFGLMGAQHMAITPSGSEIKLIGEYAKRKGIDMDMVNFVQESSDRFLPNLTETDFDLILLDGKHAFPWPVIDWFYTADKLKTGGLMIVDDAEMRAVQMLTDFLESERGWEKVKDFSGKTLVFRKLKDAVHDVAWHMQPYNAKSYLQKLGGILKKVKSKAF